MGAIGIIFAELSIGLGLALPFWRNCVNCGILPLIGELQLADGRWGRIIQNAAVFARRFEGKVTARGCVLDLNAPAAVLG